jgi:peptidoglycan hydrolase CwlO-like protein
MARKGRVSHYAGERVNMAWSIKKLTLVAGGTVIGGAACFLTAGAAAPAVGTIIGSTFMGLSGCAATSAGLAALGGGAIAAGGGGIAAGAAVITASLTGAGALLGALGMGTMANFFKEANKAFEDALYVQKDYAKAQEIIRQQEGEIRELQNWITTERSKRDKDKDEIRKLDEAIAKLTKVIDGQKEKLRKAA